MSWNIKDDRPIYSQLIDQIKIRIVSGQMAPGSKVPSVRELAQTASVNPNTMQRALAELERENLVFSQRTSGRYITEDENMIEQTREKIAQQNIGEFIKNMKSLGFTPNEMLKIVKKTIEGGISDE